MSSELEQTGHLCWLLLWVLGYPLGSLHVDYGCVETLCLHLPSKGSFEAISSSPFSGKILTNGFNVTAISLCLDLNIF